MPKNIDTNLQQAFAIKPEGALFCPRRICRRARRCLPPPAEKRLFRCVTLPDDVWARQRRKILDIAKRLYWEYDAAQMAERQAAEKAAKKAGAGESGLRFRAIPDAAQHAMMRCWSGTHRLVRIVDPVSAQHHFVSQCARDSSEERSRTAHRPVSPAVTRPDRLTCPFAATAT